MGVPDFLCLSGSAAESINPFRPSVDTVGGASFTDDSQFPPDPNIQLTASAENQNERLVVALARTCSLAVIYVKITGGTPSIFGVRCASDILVSGDFTIVDHAAGDTELKCPATKIIQPFAAMAVPQMTGDFRISAYVNGTSDGIRIETRTTGGTLADCDFLAFWM